MKLARRGLHADTRVVYRFDEGDGAAVHHRHFRTVNFDQGIVDAECGQRCQKMLDGRDRRTLWVAEDGAEFCRADSNPNGLEFLTPAKSDPHRGERLCRCPALRGKV